MKCDEETVPGPCDPLKVERIRYFTGRHMTARDFSDADAYHRSFRHLHNRILHGWGIACGLDVRLHPRSECRADRLVLRCGMAIDCCGREILVRRDVVAGNMPWDDRPKKKTNEGECVDPDYVLLLCLKYHEAYTEKVPVLYSNKACSSPAMEDGRIRECYELHWEWVRYDELGEWGWHVQDGCAPVEESGGYEKTPEKVGYEQKPEYEQKPGEQKAGHEQGSPYPQEPSHKHRDKHQHEYDHEDETPCEEPRCCLDPQCPRGHCVPLAIIRANSGEETDTQYIIDTTGRRSISQAKEHLTHVCWINWPHGGVVRVGDLDSLKVRFNRPLRVEKERAGIPGPRGINALTFVVEYGDENRDLLPYRQPPYLEADRRTAVFELADPRPGRSGRDFRYLINHVVNVTLRCDFLLDCHDHAVDGDHLHGRLPSGDGIEGGTFESWFTVMSDDDCDDHEEAMRKQAGGADAAQEQQS